MTLDRGDATDLGEACRAAGVDLGDAVTPDALADHLETAHAAELWSELPRLSELAGRVEQAHGPRHPEVVAVRSSFEALRTGLESHLMREEQIVFPLMREILAASRSVKRPNGTLRNPIDVLDDDHERVGEMLDELRVLTDSFTAPEDAAPELGTLYERLAALTDATALHMHLENLVLFPAVAAIERELLAVLEQ